MSVLAPSLGYPFAVGAATFVSPCGVALLPVYLLSLLGDPHRSAADAGRVGTSTTDPGWPSWSATSPDEGGRDEEGRDDRACPPPRRLAAQPPGRRGPCGRSRHVAAESTPWGSLGRTWQCCPQASMISRGAPGSFLGSGHELGSMRQQPLSTVVQPCCRRWGETMSVQHGTYERAIASGAEEVAAGVLAERVAATRCLRVPGGTSAISRTTWARCT